MTKLTISISDLKSAIPGFSKVIGKRPSLPVLRCVLLQSSHGQLRMTATNLDEYASVCLSARTPEKSVQACLPFDRLAKFLKSAEPEAELQLVVSESSIVVAYPLGGTVFKDTIECPPVEEFPAAPERNWSDAVPVGAEFKEALHRAFDSASTDECRLILNHAYVDVSDPKAHYVVGTNGSEMFATNSFKLGFKESLIVPNRRFLAWKGFVEDGDWKVSLAGPVEKEFAGWVRVESNNWTLITKQIDGTYPQWRSPIPASGDRTLITFNDEAREFVLKAAERLPGNEDSNRPVTVQTTQGGSVILFGRSDPHQASIPVTGATAEGNPATRNLNRKFLLKAMKLGLQELEIFDGHHVVVFRSGGKKLVVACLRPEAKPASETDKPAQPSSSPVPEPQPEEPKEKVKTINRIETTPAETVTGGAHGSTPAPPSAFEQVRLQLENAKEKLKGALADISESLKMLAQAQRERKAADREIEEVRETLQTLQKIRI